ncbi:hypothetical protein B0H14DRAFT_2639922 [Mycena olivaceomarginata]|nr:hypothetical protein B0H14DRAFT_2639922 [Mycena olivaceomarginata]
MSTLTMGAVLANAAIITSPTLDVNLCPDGSATMNVTSTLLPDGLSFVSKVCPIVGDTSLEEGTLEIGSHGLAKRGNTCGMSCVCHCESNTGGGPNTNVLPHQPWLPAPSLNAYTTVLKTAVVGSSNDARLKADGIKVVNIYMNFGDFFPREEPHEPATTFPNASSSSMQPSTPHNILSGNSDRLATLSCTHPGCGHRANRLCQPQKCCTHCVTAGGCVCPGHDTMAPSAGTKPFLTDVLDLLGDVVRAETPIHAGLGFSYDLWALWGSDEDEQIALLHAEANDHDPFSFSSNHSFQKPPRPTPVALPPSDTVPQLGPSTQKKRTIEPTASDDEVEFVSYRRLIKQEPITPPPKPKRRRFSSFSTAVSVGQTPSSSPSPPASVPVPWNF